MLFRLALDGVRLSQQADGEDVVGLDFGPDDLDADADLRYGTDAKEEIGFVKEEMSMT